MTSAAATTNRAREIFHDAVERLQPDQWPAYLDSACQGDDTLRRQVERLLTAHGQLNSFMGQPAAGPAATIDQPAERIGAMIGPYKLLEQIGEGGMGLVYMAEQQQPVRRLVALKIIKPGMDSKQVIARFEAERQALAMMDHSNIAKVLEAGTISSRQTPSAVGQQDGTRSVPTTEGRPFFVMELVRGLPISEFCEQKHLPLRERLELFIQVCQAVQHAHQKGIIHRDLKPTNVLVTLADTVPVPKVIDFGIAKALGQSLTDHTLHTGYSQLIGTPLYMSPEQAELNQFGVDTRSDVYSLGVMLYELLTGTTPFDKDRLKSATFDEMRRIIREEEPETVSARIAKTRSAERGARSESIVPRSELRAPRSSELDWIVSKSLEKDRSRRYESASALAADIQRYLSDEPVLACPPTTMYRLQKFARKHKPALATAAAIAFSLLLGTTVSAWQAVRATTAEAQATANEAQAKASAQQAEVKAHEATTQRDEAARQRDEVKSLYEKLQASNAQLEATQAQLRSTLYASNINFAQHAWNASDVGRVQELLEQHRPKPGQADPRGFEWHHLYRLSHTAVLNIKSSSRSVAYSPDGKRLAGIESDVIKVWDAQTGEQLLSLKGGTLAGNFGNCVAFSPDGKRLAAYDGVESRVVKVWDAQSGEEFRTLKGYTGNVGSVAFSADGKRLATSGWADQTAWKAGQGQLKSEVKVWDIQNGVELFSIKETEHSIVGSMAFRPDGKQLASGCTVFDAQTGQVLFDFKQAGDTRVAYSPDGQRLAGASGRKLHVWDTQTGRELHALTGQSGSFKSVAYSPDGKYLVTASADSNGSIKVWDAESAQEVHTIKLGGWINGIAYSPDGNHLVTAGSSIIVSNSRPDQNPVTLKASSWYVSTAAFSPDGTRLVSGGAGSSSKEVRVWDATTGKELFSLNDKSARYISTVAWSPDGKRLFAGGDDTAQLWDADSGQVLLRFDHAADSSIRGLAFSPDGKRLATCGGGRYGQGRGHVKVWDAQTGRELFALENVNHFGSVTFSPDGKNLAGGTDYGVKIWDALTGQELFSIKAPGSRLVFAPDGKSLAGSSRGRVRVWDVQTGKELLTLPAASTIGLAFSPDGKRLVRAASDKTVKVFDSETGQELLAFEGHDQDENGVAFSPDGHRLAAGSADGTLRIYDATPLTQKP